MILISLISNEWESIKIYIKKVVIVKKCGITTSTELQKKSEFGGIIFIYNKTSKLKVPSR